MTVVGPGILHKLSFKLFSYQFIFFIIMCMVVKNVEILGEYFKCAFVT